MSITTARNFLEKSGCGWIVSIGLGIVIVLGLIVQFGMGGGQQQDIPREQLEPIATIGAQPVSANAVERHFRAQGIQQLNKEGGAPVALEAFVYGSVLDALLQQAAQLELASRRGIKVSDDDIIAYVGSAFDDRVKQLKEQYKQFGLIKPDATEAEIQQAIAPNFGGDIAKARKQAIDQATSALDDPTIKPEYVFAATSSKLLNAYTAMSQVSDEDLKKAQHKTTFKRISFRINSGVEPMTALDIKKREAEKLAQAEKVLSDIKSGRISFEAAMEKYSDDTAPQGKKKSESTIDLQYSVLTFDPGYKELIPLKPGEVSPVIFMASQGQVAIFKAIKTDASVPSDFEQKKADYRKTRLTQLASMKLRDDTEELSEHDAVKWSSAGFRALHHWYTVYGDMELLRNPSKQVQELQKVSDEAKKAVDEADLVGRRAASLAYFASLDQVYEASSADKKKSMAETWAEAAASVLENSENVDLRLALAGVFLDLQRKDEAAESLIAASRTNAGQSDNSIRRYKEIQSMRKKLEQAGVSKESLKELDDSQAFWANDAVESLKGEAELNEDYTEAGRTKFGEINTKLDKLKALGLIKPDDVKAVENFQNRWKTEKAKYDEEQAKERKKAAEEAKKAAEEAKKKANADKKTGASAPSAAPTPSGTGGATPPSNPLTGTKAGG